MAEIVEAVREYLAGVDHRAGEQNSHHLGTVGGGYMGGDSGNQEKALWLHDLYYFGLRLGGHDLPIELQYLV